MSADRRQMLLCDLEACSMVVSQGRVLGWLAIPLAVLMRFPEQADCEGVLQAAYNAVEFLRGDLHVSRVPI